MTIAEAKHKLDFMKKAYQKLIDEKVDNGILVGKDVTGVWKADATLDEAYKSMIEALEIAIQALEQQPCEDCISRQAVLGAMYALCDAKETLKENPWRDNPHIDAIIDTIDDLPSVTPQTKVGEWLKNGELCKCSNCHSNVLFSAVKLYNYCYRCGAKMEVET